MASRIYAVFALLLVAAAFAAPDADVVSFTPFPRKHCGWKYNAWDSVQLTPGQCKTLVSLDCVRCLQACRLTAKAELDTARMGVSRLHRQLQLPRHTDYGP